MKKVLIAIAVACVFVLPHTTHAAGVMYGGLSVFEIPCTCSPFTWQMFVPLFLSSPLPVAGPLDVPDSGFTFAFWQLFPSRWALGFYLPGVQSCYMYAVAGCFMLPALGTITPFSGSSLTI